MDRRGLTSAARQRENARTSPQTHWSPAITHFADKLLDAIDAKGSPICIGLDPVFERLPHVMRAEADDEVTAIELYVDDVLEAVAEIAPCVKLQLACFERYDNGAGIAVFENAVDLAHELGLLVIADAKRGDIGISAEHYAHAFFGEAGAADPSNSDALTVNPYLGADSLDPFIKTAAAGGQGLFPLVRTSNPGGDAIQALRLEDGRTVAEAVADLIAQAGRSDPAYIGERGYSHVGAVVGATKRDEIAALRQRMPQQLFLVPGFGAQGGSADDVRGGFKPDGTGALITASRSVIYAFDPDDRNWQHSVQKAARQFHAEVRAILD